MDDDVREEAEKVMDGTSDSDNNVVVISNMSKVHFTFMMNSMNAEIITERISTRQDQFSPYAYVCMRMSVMLRNVNYSGFRHPNSVVLRNIFCGLGAAVHARA
jgi:hypothetical protein